MATRILISTARFDYRAGGDTIATGTAAEVLAKREELGPGKNETLTVLGPLGGLVRSIRTRADRRPITGAIVPFATLSRLAGGHVVTVELL